MGAWSHESFANDDACDWASQLEDSNDLKLIEATLNAVLEVGDETLETQEASEGIAAAEAIASLQGHSGKGESNSEEVDEWAKRVKLHPSAALIAKAHQALDRIIAEPSELLESWEESGDERAWLDSVKDLKSRIDG